MRQSAEGARESVFEAVRVAAVVAEHRLGKRFGLGRLGFLWRCVMPLVGLFFYTAVFHRVLRVPSEGAPYWAFAYTGIIPWFYFNRALFAASTALRTYHRLAANLPLPRLAYPCGVAMHLTLELLAGLAVAVAVLAVAGMRPTTAALWVPVFAFVQGTLALGLGLFLCVLHSYSRRVSTLARSILPMWMLLTPVLYSLREAEGPLEAFHRWDPMASVLAGYRAVLLHGAAPDPVRTAHGIAVSTALLALGVVLFVKSRGRLEDEL